MIFNPNNINLLNVAMRIMEIRSRFCRYGIMTVEEYQNARVGIMEEPLLYDPMTLDEDGMYTIFAGYHGCQDKYFEDMYVRLFPGETREEDFIEIAIPVVFDESCHMCDDAVCAECSQIAYYQLYFIGRDGRISEDIESVEDEDCECCCECNDCNEKYPSAGEMLRCRESGAHNLCNCECGEEHCFVECGPDPEAECEFNENGRCHCQYNRCCGCDNECEPDEED